VGTIVPLSDASWRPWRFPHRSSLDHSSDGDVLAWKLKDAIRHLFWDLRLDLNAGKSRIYRMADGVTFLGWSIVPDHTRLVRPNIIRFRRHMRGMPGKK
jgi:hypothetical protein